MRRRDFITALGAAVVWPFAATAQSRSNPPVVGILMPEPLPFPAYDAFQQGLRDCPR